MDLRDSLSRQTDIAELESHFLSMNRIRKFEERAEELFEAGELKGTAHSCAGQEAIAVGACSVLKDTDFITSHHRGHGHCIAKGASLNSMMAELLGRATGYSRGFGGSMHIAAPELGVLGANGIVGAGIGIAAGAGLSAKLRGSDQVCVAFFGDGAVNEGIFHEALNLAAIWKLPVIFVCENNRYGLSMAFENASAVPKVAMRAPAYGIPGLTVDGNDVLAVSDAVRHAVKRAREGEGPSLIEAETYRIRDHSMRTNLPRYRPQEEEKLWRERDPILTIETLLKKHQVSLQRIETLVKKAVTEVEIAATLAIEAAEPVAGDLFTAVSAPESITSSEPDPSDRKISFTQAINEALDQAMEADESVFLMGQDIGQVGGLFTCTKDLLEKHGPERVRDTPICEAATASAAVGAALTGMRPVVEVQFVDFVTHMMDAIVNQAAKLRFMMGGIPTMPLVIRGPQGAGIRLGAQHSQCLEVWFAHIPGLIVIAPSNPYDAKGLLISAIQSSNPVIFLEHKLLYQKSMGSVPAEPYALPIGKASIRREGADVTIVATSSMVDVAISASRQMSKEGIEAEIIDPRTLRPLDTDTILASVRKTNRCVVVNEGWRSHGFGAEISATIAELAFDYLDAPVARIGMDEIPMPYNHTLENDLIPSAREIIQAAREVCYKI